MAVTEVAVRAVAREEVEMAAAQAVEWRAAQSLRISNRASLRSSSRRSSRTPARMRAPMSRMVQGFEWVCVTYREQHVAACIVVVSGLPFVVGLAFRDEMAVVPVVHRVLVLVASANPARKVVGFDGDGIVESRVG